MGDTWPQLSWNSRDYAICDECRDWMEIVPPPKQLDIFDVEEMS